ncbi:hypothetical protein [Sporolactobacillus sp. THM19-2]|jgi:hypothetical protein|uniref:hypothetical protein n=1 Tax=Sporolactobacillus sp. THM19-2 TaxID=2511171 RepID=UPI0010211AAF|nr:hypothetical protein [Sporolactobacillus sp. THM19-2]RYL94420.1 hypothetical protein EWH91_00040 [Sporolactobacillus sp. THM19-2]
MTARSKHDSEMIEIWDDVVRIRDLVLAIAINSITTLGGYFAAPDHAPMPLLFGLIGAVIGFMICSLFIKPKRIFEKSERKK